MSTHPRWDHLVAQPFAIDDAPADSLLEQTQAALASLDEVFPRSLDPIDDPAGYAVRRFVRAVGRLVGPRVE